MVSLFLLLGCNLSYIVDLFTGLHEHASASAGTFTKARIIGAHAVKTPWRHLKLIYFGVEIEVFYRYITGADASKQFAY